MAGGEKGGDVIEKETILVGRDKIRYLAEYTKVFCKEGFCVLI